MTQMPYNADGGVAKNIVAGYYKFYLGSLFRFRGGRHKRDNGKE